MSRFLRIFVEQTILLAEVPCYPRTNISQVDLKHTRIQDAEKLLSLSLTFWWKINIKSKQFNSLVINQKKKKKSGKLSTFLSIGLKAKYET